MVLYRRKFPSSSEGSITGGTWWLSLLNHIFSKRQRHKIKLLKNRLINCRPGRVKSKRCEGRPCFGNFVNKKITKMHNWAMLPGLQTGWHLRQSTGTLEPGLWRLDAIISEVFTSSQFSSSTAISPLKFEMKLVACPSSIVVHLCGTRPRACVSL